MKSSSAEHQYSGHCQWAVRTAGELRCNNKLSYSQVVACMQQQFSPSLNEIAHSYQFFMCNQLPKEPVWDFIMAICRIADTCSFGTLFDRMLQGRTVCGLQNSTVRRHLLTKSSPTWVEAEENALVAEMAEKSEKAIPGAGKGRRHPGIAKLASKSERMRHQGTALQMWSKWPQHGSMQIPVRTQCNVLSTNANSTATVPECAFTATTSKFGGLL